MKKFQHNSFCVACGATEAKSIFRNGSLYSYMLNPKDKKAGLIQPEFIQRICHRCGFTWNELPLYTMEKEDGE